jgi:hypothetical protein
MSRTTRRRRGKPQVQSGSKVDGRDEIELKILDDRKVAFSQREPYTATPTSEGVEMANTTPQTGYAPVNGLNIYYEIHGTGQPLILLHGGVGAIEMFGEVLQLLAAGRQVIALELQGHGHTADIDRPLT